MASESAREAFPTIESAYDYLTLLGQAVDDTRRELASEVRAALRSKQSRRLQGYQLAAYRAECLAAHLAESRRALNDLRSLRRLLLSERTSLTGAGEPS